MCCSWYAFSVREGHCSDQSMAVAFAWRGVRVEEGAVAVGTHWCYKETVRTRPEAWVAPSLLLRAAMSRPC